MSRKCFGCGSILQSTRVDGEGYIQEEKLETAQLCLRCFRIQHYGDYKNVVKDNGDFVPILDEIKKTGSLVLLVVDLFHLPRNFNLLLEHLDNPIFLVLTKRDLLPKDIYEEKLISYMKSFSLPVIDTLIVSGVNNYQLDLLMEKIESYQTNEQVYVVGYTNAGKSTLINQLIHNYTEHIPGITTSMLPSTTLHSLEIRFHSKLTLVDTPGLLEEGSIEHFVDVSMLKRIIPKKNIRPIVYQIKQKQFISVGDLFLMKVEYNNITMYFSNQLKIERFYKERGNNFVFHEIHVSPHSDLVISGLGFIKFMKEETISFWVLPGVDVYVRPSFL